MVIEQTARGREAIAQANEVRYGRLVDFLLRDSYIVRFFLYHALKVELIGENRCRSKDGQAKYEIGEREEWVSAARTLMCSRTYRLLGDEGSRDGGRKCHDSKYTCDARDACMLYTQNRELCSLRALFQFTQRESDRHRELWANFLKDRAHKCRSLCLGEGVGNLYVYREE